MAKIKKLFNLADEYKKIWKYLKESKKFIYFTVALFFFFALIGFFIPAPLIIQEKIIQFMRDILEQIKNMSQFELIRFIIINNIQSTFFGIFLGFLFGIFPILGAITNGYLLGFVSLSSVSNGGVLTLWKILPHGIFELPAVFISLGLGLKISTFIFQKKKLVSLRENLTNSLRVFLLVIIPLLIIAGIIEGTLIALSR